MVLKSFMIDFNGKQEEVSYETELTFGETEQIINQSIDLTDIQHPKVKIGPFRINILMKALRKAPFSFLADISVKAQPNSVINAILDKVMEDYPLVNFLGDWMTSFMGSEVESELPSELTPSAQPSTDGPKKKQTSTEQSSSKSS